MNDNTAKNVFVLFNITSSAIYLTVLFAKWNCAATFNPIFVYCLNCLSHVCLSFIQQV